MIGQPGTIEGVAQGAGHRSSLQVAQGKSTAPPATGIWRPARSQRPRGWCCWVSAQAPTPWPKTLLPEAWQALQPFQYGEGPHGTSRDEDINTLATIIPSIEILGPITRSRAQQLNHQVNSFLCSSACNIGSRLLPNDLLVLRNQGEDHGGQTEHQVGAGEPRERAREGDEPIQFGIAEFESNSESRTTSYST
jgi:hypothetical protein